MSDEIQRYQKTLQQASEHLEGASPTDLAPRAFTLQACDAPLIRAALKGLAQLSAPAERLADVRLGAEAMLAACKATTPYEQDTDCWPDPARIAETVRLPVQHTAQLEEAKEGERFNGERVAMLEATVSNLTRTQLTAQLEAAKADAETVRAESVEAHDANTALRSELADLKLEVARQQVLRLCDKALNEPQPPAPAPAECYACKYSQGPHTHQALAAPAPAPVCKTCGGES